MDRYGLGIVDALTASEEHSQAVVNILPAHLELLVVESDLHDAVMPDQLQGTGDRAHTLEVGCLQIGRPELVQVIEGTTDNREEDTGVLDQPIGKQQLGSHYRTSSIVHMLQPAWIGELHVSIDEQAMHLMLKRCPEADVDAVGEALVETLEVAAPVQIVLAFEAMLHLLIQECMQIDDTWLVWTGIIYHKD